MPNHENSPILVWCGRFFSFDGYGTAAQLHVSALRAENIPVVAVDLNTRVLVGPVADGLVRVDSDGDVMRITAVDPSRRIVVVVHDRPDQYPKISAQGRSRVIGYSYWEASHLPPTWSGFMSSMDGIWTSSDFNRAAFVESGVPRWMIETVGHPVDQLLVDVHTSTSSYRERWPESTVFLSVASSALGRRDLALLLESYAMAFGADDDVALVLKVPPTDGDRVRETITSVMGSMPARGSGQWPTVHVVESRLSREQMVRLHASVDCYVSCERGDGWDLPAMDSLLLGVPVVATDFGASTMFLQQDDCYLVHTSTEMVRCDDVLHERHPLYSGQFWPYVDPSVLARSLREVHENPEDRRRRGAQARSRMHATYDRKAVVGEVLALTSRGTEVDFRSNDVAQITIDGPSACWSTRQSHPLAAHPGVDEARLLEILGDPRFLRPRNPRSFLDVYGKASSFAAGRAGLSETATGSAMSRSMAVGISDPVAKLRALRGLQRSVAAGIKRFGGFDQVQSVVDVADDYAKCIQGREVSSIGAEGRRATWGKFGPFVSPKADLDRLDSLRNRHLGERIFILGNGPSLLKCDLSLLHDQYTFGVNKIYMLFDKIEWRPDYFTLLDWKMGDAIRDELHQLDGVTKFFPERFRGILPSSEDVYWYWPRAVGQHADDQFEPNMLRGVPSRATVLVTAIQQAFHLGFRDIVLIGVDASYVIPESVIQSGPDRFKTGVKLNLESTADDDPNHFAPSYFGKGARWHDPNVSDMRRMFRLMRKGVERHGGTLRNATVGGELEELERVDYASLFA